MAIRRRDTSSTLLKEIDDKIGEVRTEAIDLSFGEIISLKSENELIIDPEYQRLFRWSDEQKSRLVESILLRLPIPPVFFIENEDGRLELIDGLQRISSMIQLVDPELIGAGDLELTGCELIKQLNGLTYRALPLALQLQLKRSPVRAVVIKRQSKSFLRYVMFKRLNTGGSLLSSQELRNCSARLFGDEGAAFYDFLVKLAKFEPFFKVTETLADADQDKRGREELVLRFFAAKNGQPYYAGHVSDWLDDYMEAVLLHEEVMDLEEEESQFERVFHCISRVLGESAFCKYSQGQPTGGLAPAHYEAIAIAFNNKIDTCENKNPERLLSAVVNAKQSNPFRANVGPGANNKTKLAGRIKAIEDAVERA